jgi:hypothetical protein
MAVSALLVVVSGLSCRPGNVATGRETLAPTVRDRQPADGPGPRIDPAAAVVEDLAVAGETSGDTPAADASLEAAHVDEALEFTRYPAGVVHSPLTSGVIERLREVVHGRTDGELRVFMKVGASDTVDRRNLQCFAGGSHPFFHVDLGDRPELEPTLEFFRSGDARGINPFVRTSLAAKVGRSAVWAISGGPTPIHQERRAIRPAWALVAFGTNDLNLGTSPRDSVWAFRDNMAAVIDLVVAEAVVPIVIGVSPRNDSGVAAAWAPTFNTVLRSLAESRQVPFVDLLYASGGLPGRGMAGDGVHGNSYQPTKGVVQPCVFTAEGLQYHYNVRNLVTLEALDRLRRAVVESVEPEAPPLAPIEGEGVLGSPFVIDAVPFTHMGDTATSDQRSFDRYPDCDDGQDESGPEVVYRLDVVEDRSLRVLLFASGQVDADLHVLDESAETCMFRDGRLFEGTVRRGSYLLVVDTFVGRDGRERSGEYLLVVTPCEPGDRACERHRIGPAPHGGA